MIKPKVLFLCSGNSRRTQMGEAVAAMREMGLDISGCPTKKVDPFLGERVSYLITLCDRKIERTCPIFPGAIWRLTWPIENPAMAHSREERRAMVRRARDEIRKRGGICAGEYLKAKGQQWNSRT